MKSISDDPSVGFEPRDSAKQPGLLAINLVGLATIVHKEVRRILRIWVQTIIPPAIQATLYFVIFGGLIGRRVGDMGGIPYITFIAPGLIMNSVIQNSFGNVVSSFFSGKLQLHLEEMLVSPLSYATIVIGYVAGGVCRGLFVGALVTVVAMFFAHLRVEHVLVTLSVIVLTAMVFSLGGLLNALFAKNFDEITILPTFVLTPLSYFGGVFYSIALLPSFWQKVSLADPILYMVNAFRYGMLGQSDIPVGVTYAVILTAFCVLFALAMILLKRGVGIRS